MSQDEFNMNTNIFPSKFFLRDRGSFIEGQLTNNFLDSQFMQENSKHQSSENTMNESNEISNNTNHTITKFPSFSSPIPEPIQEEPPAKVEEPFITSPMPPEGIPTIQSQENFSQYYLHSNKEATQTQESNKDNGSLDIISSNQDTQPKTGSFQTEGQENIFLNGECFSVSPPKENYPSAQHSVVIHKKRGRKPGQKVKPRKKIKSDEEEYRVEDDLAMVPETSSDDEDFDEDRDEYVNNVKREEKGSTNERKEYTVYEDWRILEATDDYIEHHGPKGLQSIVKWKKLRDPLTGEKVLFEERSFESMRDRYKRYIMVFNKEDKASIRKFCREHPKEELLTYHCLFKKIDKNRKFIGISMELNYDPKRISRRTFYNTSYKEKRAKKKEAQEKQEGEVKIKKKRGRKKKQQPQESTLEQDKSEVEKYFDNNFEENDENTRDNNNKLFVLARDDNYLENQQMMTSFTDHHPQQSQMMMIAKPFKVIHPSPPYNAQWQQDSGHFISNVYPKMNAPFESKFFHWESSFLISPGGAGENSNSMRDLYMFNNGSSQESRGKIPPVPINRSHQRRSTSTLKDICLDEDFKGAELKVSKAFKTKKPNQKPLKDDIMIFADYQEKCRHFVKERRGEPSYPKMPPNVFEKLARTYGLTIDKLMDYYNSVSCNIADLEEYLQTKNGNILWTKEEDQSLMQNVNIQLFKALKTERRVQERLNYLGA